MRNPREIKFRAWDRDSKRMLKVSYLSWYYKYDPNGFDNNIPSAMAFGTEEDEKRRIESGGSISITADGRKWEYGLLQIGLQNFELMQFTGLKDKNGKEIYEGDRIRISDEYGNEDTGFIGYKEREMAFVVDWGNNRYRRIMDSEDVIEVIGNLYENPELLK